MLSVSSDTFNSVDIREDEFIIFSSLTSLTSLLKIHRKYSVKWYKAFVKLTTYGLYKGGPGRIVSCHDRFDDPQAGFCVDEARIMIEILSIDFFVFTFL